MREVRPTDDEWTRRYEELTRFASEHHHTYPARDSELGKWVAHQRRRRQRLSAERQVMLEAVVGWGWTRSDAAWTRRFQELMEFSEEHGHASPPQSTALGKWVAQQRTYRNKGTLPPDRVRELESIPHWVWTGR